MSYAIRVAVVNGYGTRLDETYKQHLDIVAEKMCEFHYVICSGGFTNPKTPLSEAQLMLVYLAGKKRQMVTGSVYPFWLKEEEALTTNDNLRYSKTLLQEFNIAPGEYFEVTVFCKKPWWLKVRLLSWLLLRRPGIKVRVRGTAPGTSWKEYVKQIFVGAPIDVLAVFFPAVQNLKLKRRANK